MTGAAGGIGAAVVAALRARVAHIAVADRDVSGIEAEAHLPGNLLEASYADGLPAASQAAGGGAIVNAASCWGLRPGPNHAVYCMTKAAIASLT